MPTLRDAKQHGSIESGWGLRRGDTEPEIMDEFGNVKKKKKNPSNKGKFWEPDENTEYSQGDYLYDESIKDRTRNI